jgi:hypothetical protein
VRLSHNPSSANGGRSSDRANRAQPAALPAVELLRLEGPLDWVRTHRQRAVRTLEIATRGVPKPLLFAGDSLAHLWLQATRNPWRGLIRSLGDALDHPGVALMNLCYEWGCTTAAGQFHGRPAMARTVDWPFVGLGSLVVVVIEPGRYGPVAFITWPGFVGAVTAFAPGRFAIAVNKAPQPVISRSLKLDRIAAAIHAFSSGGLPITHLVRQVALEAPDFTTVMQELARPRRVTAPGLVVACGVRPEETAVIERFQTHAKIHRSEHGNLCVANDWLTPGRRGWPPAAGATPEQRVEDCRCRVQSLSACFPAEPRDFSWVVPPVLNNNTRAALFCSPAEERLVVQGFDLLGKGPAAPVTAVLDITHIAP